MKCPACGHENRENAKFCLGCGHWFSAACESCGAQLPAGARFCDECGQGVSQAKPSEATRDPLSYTPKHLAEKILTSRSALEGERKTITALFADIKGSMELLEDLDPEEARRVIDPALRLMMDAVHRYEGYVAQSTGIRFPIAGPGPDRRREEAAAVVAQMKRITPGIDAMHYIDAAQPEECMFLLDDTFRSFSFWVFFPVYGYLEWYLRQDLRGRNVPVLSRHDSTLISRCCVAASKGSKGRSAHPRGIRESLADDLLAGPPSPSCNPHLLPFNFSC